MPIEPVSYKQVHLITAISAKDISDKYHSFVTEHQLSLGVWANDV